MKNIENISDTLAERFGVSKQDSKIFTEGVFKEISNCLVNNKEEVRIKNFGTFKFGKSAGRTTKHPVTKEIMTFNAEPYWEEFPWSLFGSDNFD